MPDKPFQTGAAAPHAAEEWRADYPLGEMLAAAFSVRLWLLLAFVMPPLVAVSLLFILPPTYRAQTALLVKNGREYLAQGTTEGVQSGPTITKLEEINSELELLGDRSVLEETVKRIGLATLFPALWHNPPRSGSLMDAAVRRLAASLGVSPVKMSNVIDLTFDYENDQAMPARVLDTYVAVYLEKHAAVFTAGRASSFQASILRDTAELDRLEQQQSAIKLDHRIYDIGAQRTAIITQRVEAETHLLETADRQATLARRIDYLAGIQGGLSRTLTSTESSPSEEITRANEALSELLQSRSALLGRYAQANPDVRRLDDQIEAARQRLRETRIASVHVNTAPSLLPQQVLQELVMDRAELAPLAGEILRYRTHIEAYGDELQRLERADTELRMIQSHIEALRDNLKTIRALYDVARTQDEMDRQRLASVVQVAPSLTPHKAVKPARLLFAAGGLLLGVLTASGVAVLSIVTRSVLFTAEGVAAQTGLPVLASVPLLSRPWKAA